MTIAGPRTWLDDCGLDARGFRNWWIDIEVRSESGSESALEVSVTASECAVRFRHGAKQSDIRFSGSTCDVGRDELELVTDVAGLPGPGALFRWFEARFGVALRRHSATVRSNLPDAPKLVRGWLVCT